VDSGSITANIGTSGSLALDATLTGGTQKAIVRGGAKGTTTAADVTSTAEGTDHQALDVQIYHSGTAKDPTAIRVLTSSDVVTVTQATAANLNATVVQGTGTNLHTVIDSGSITVTQATGTNLHTVIDSGTISLPSGAATSALQTSGNSSLSSVDTKTPVLGQTVMASSSPVVIASNQSAVPVSGTVTANAGTGPFPVSDNGGSLTVDAIALPLPTGAATETTLAAVSAKLPATLGQKAMTASMAVVIASDQPSISTKLNSSTATLTNVAGSASSVTLLSANANRLGATIVNDSSAILYVKFGTTASSTSYTVRMTLNAYYEVPFGYTGRIDGIWTVAAGNARITELT